jgi:hypothetical protein
MNENSTQNPRDAGRIARTLLTLYALEGAAGLTLFGFYKLEPLHAGTALSRFGVMTLIGAVATAAVGAFLFASGRRAPRALGVAAATNLISLAIAFALVESSLRLLARKTPDGIAIGNVLLRPTWPEVVESSRALLQGRTPEPRMTYFIYDPELGWTVGPGRQSTDGLYASSAEGIRSARPGVVFAGEPANSRVALIGDSNAFSLDVPFEDSLGYQLGQLLGGDIQVLNFGVDGYGIDQMYLRYRRDVRPWKPAAVLVVFIQHDLMRSMAVYPLVSFGWGGYLVKPRFDLENDRLTIVNRPLPSPEQILGAAAPRELPYIDYDPTFMSTDWDWRFERGPMLLRLLTSVSPAWPNKPPRGHADTVTLNHRLIRELYSSIRGDGAVPILVYLPQWVGSDALARTVLPALGLPYLDMTACVMKVPKDQRRVPGHNHYARMGNGAIAQCVLPEVRCALGGACG